MICWGCEIRKMANGWSATNFGGGDVGEISPAWALASSVPPCSSTWKYENALFSMKN